MRRERALKAANLQATDRIPHWEHFSNPAFEQMVTGIDPWQHPQQARRRLLALMPMDVGDVPLTDDPIEHIPDDQLSFTDSDGTRHARWGTGKSWHWDWGKRFTSVEDVLAYEPMRHLDQRNTGIVAEYDYGLSVAELARQFQERLDARRALAGEFALMTLGFYNTLFMWPLLTFGWELMLEVGAAYEEDMRRLLAQFAERSRKVFLALAKTDVEVVTSHDDICYARGPVFNPAWLRRMIYPYYEEFWGYLRQAGKKVFFISDGNIDLVADDIIACGAHGLISEPFTNWPEIAARHPDAIMLGDGDNRVIAGGDREAIFAMVKRMCGWGKQYAGYFLCCGNHLPYTLPAQGIKHYFDASEEFGWRC